jgi:UDP-N-acetylmuramyl pentapeptide synthase
MTLAQAQGLLPGSRLHGDGARRFARLHSDTRTLRPGDLFVALRGERFDGHDHLAQAMRSGAAAVLAARGFGPGVPGLEVADPLAALQQLAGAWRAALDLPLVAVTGSNGKTTVTQMCGAILRAWLGEAALVTEGNLNNHIGVPLMLLRLRGQAGPNERPGDGPGDDAARPAHRAAVLELGMNHPGEIAPLARLVAPTVALVNNAQREHQEFMATVEAVARENGAVLQALRPGGCAVLPAWDAFTPLWRTLAGPAVVLTFGLDEDRAGGAAAADPADVAAARSPEPGGLAQTLALRTPQGAATLRLALPGPHNARNALAAAACALATGAPLAAVVAGLQGFAPVAGRSAAQPLRLPGGHALVLVDDSYNANPDSVLAAVDLLAALPGPHWLVLGDMGEVGTQGPAFHAEVGQRVRERGIAHCWTVGTLAAHAGAPRHFADVPALLAALPEGLAARPGAVLVKGSRFMRMERVVQALRAAAQPAATGEAARCS